MTTETAPPAGSDPLPAPFLRRVWERMAAIYPNRWRAAMGESPNKPDGELTIYGDTWAKGLCGLQTSEIARGLEACITRPDPWPPVLAEFRALCLGVPPLIEVRADLAREHALRAPFTVMVGRRLDGYRYRMADAREADRMLLEAYNDAREARMRGEALPAQLEAITQEDAAQVVASPEVAARAFEEIQAILRRTAQAPETGEGETPAVPEEK